MDIVLFILRILIVVALSLALAMVFPIQESGNFKAKPVITNNMKLTRRIPCWKRSLSVRRNGVVRDWYFAMCLRNLRNQSRRLCKTMKARVAGMVNK